TTTTDEATNPNGSSCTMATSGGVGVRFVHSYTTSLTITSPSGRRAALTTYGQAVGGQGMGTNTANASLGVCIQDNPSLCETGIWLYDGSEMTNCSLAGDFYNIGFDGNKLISVRQAVTTYKIQTVNEDNTVTFV